MTKRIHKHHHHKLHHLLERIAYEILLGLCALINVFLSVDDLLNLSVDYATDKECRNMRLACGCLEMADRARRAPHLFMLPECRLIG